MFSQVGNSILAGRSKREIGLTMSTEWQRAETTHAHKGARNSIHNCALYIQHVMEHTDLEVNVSSIS